MGKYKIVCELEDDVNKLSSVKQNFLRRQFSDVAKELEKLDENECDQPKKEINKALMHHILGMHKEAVDLYEKYVRQDICAVNYLAFCHRYFDYERVVSDNAISVETMILPYANNILNYHLATEGIESVRDCPIQMTVFSEQIINDVYSKAGMSLLHEQNDLLKEQYLNSIEVVEKKRVNNSKKRVGIFVTDIQRHKDASMVFELVECLHENFDIIIYFNNIFANKLTKAVADSSMVRYVVNLYYEELNNLIFDDGIDVLIDLAGYGLRNNNIALALQKNVIGIEELLLKFPVMLDTGMYFSNLHGNKKNDVTCVLGDLRCIDENELLMIKNAVDGKLVFESHALDEEVFKQNFEKRLIKAGFNMSNVDLLKGVLPFSDYMNFISSCKMLILSGGSSYVELAEALKSGSSLMTTSRNEVIRNAFGIYYTEGVSGVNSEIALNKSKAFENALNDYLMSVPENELVKVKNKKSRIVYIEDERIISINNTCNGDIIILDE